MTQVYYMMAGACLGMFIGITVGGMMGYLLGVTKKMGERK